MKVGMVIPASGATPQQHLVSLDTALDACASLRRRLEAITAERDAILAVLDSPHKYGGGLSIPLQKAIAAVRKKHQL